MLRRSELLGPGNFDAAVGIGQLELAAAGADGAVQRFGAHAARRGDRKIAGDTAKRGVSVDVISEAVRDADADGGERSLERNVAATAGRTRGSDGNPAVLVIHGNFAAHGVERYTGEGSGRLRIALHVARGDRAIGIFHDEIAVDAIGGNAAEAGLGESVAADVSQRDAAIAGDGTEAFGDIRGLDSAERGFQLHSAMGGAQRDFSVGGFRIERAGDVAQLEFAEGIANGDGAAKERAAINAAVAGRAIYPTLDLGKRDVSEAVSNIGGAANVRYIDIAVIVVNHQVAVDVAGFHAAERRGDIGGTDLHYSDCPVSTRDGGRASNIAHGDAAESIAHFERAFHLQDLYGAVVVGHRHVAGCAIQLDTSKRVGEARGAGVADVE